MKPDTTKVMQEALQAAVTRMNSGAQADAPAAPTDPIGALMSILPKLLSSNETGEELLEKLDSLQKGDITALREQVLILRKQTFRVLKAQEQILSEFAGMQKQQAAIGEAVLELAQQMARLRFVEADGDIDDDTDDDDRRGAAPPPPSQASGAPSETRRAARGRAGKTGRDRAT